MHVQLHPNSQSTLASSLPLFLVFNHASWRLRSASRRLLSDRLYQLYRSLLPLRQRFLHSHHPHRRRNGGRARPRHLHDLLHQAFHSETPFSVGFGKSSVVTVELGRCFASTSITLLLSAAPNRRPLPWKIPVGVASSRHVQIQAEISYIDRVSKQRLTRLQTFCVPGTDDRVDFLSRIDGYSTAVLIAKDVCSNVESLGSRVLSSSIRRLRSPTM